MVTPVAYWPNLTFLCLVQMFEFLLDDCSDSPDGGNADQAAAAAVGNPAGDVAANAADHAPRGIRRPGGQPGARLNQETRLRLGVARSRAHSARLKQASQRLTATISPPLESFVAMTVFGGVSVGNASASGGLGGAAALGPSASEGARRDDARCRDLGIHSYIRGQGACLANFLVQENLVSAFSTNIMDDASMWVRRLLTPEEAAAAKEELAGRGAQLDPVKRRLLKKQLRRGKNMHAPVLNMVEALYVVRQPDRGGSGVLATSIGAPAQCLPKQNATTIRSRWLQWTAMSVEGAGRKIDNDAGDLQRAVDHTPWRITCTIHDNLQANNVVVSFEETAAEIIQNTAESEELMPTCMHVNCTAHSAVLTMKPMFQEASFNELPTFLVKLGHVLESSRSMADFAETFAKVIKDKFTYTRCLSLPPGCKELIRKNRWKLRKCRPARDLTEDDEEQILAAANGCWDDEDDTQHNCVVGECPLGCRNKKDSLEKVTRVLLMLAGRLVVALLYRWKGFDQALSWAVRGRAVHNLLGRTLAKMFPKQAAAAAQANLDAQPERGDAQRLKHTVRGGACAQWMALDKGGKRLLTCVVVNEVFQHYLNSVLAAEKTSCAFAELAAQMPWDDPVAQRAQQQDKKFKDAMEASVRNNLKIIDGTRLRQLQKHGAALLQCFSSEGWQGCPALEHHEREGVCVALVKGLGDAWRRAQNLKRFKLFTVCRLPLDAFTFEVLEEILRPLQQAAQACADCVDRCFTKIWLRRLSNRATAKKAHRVLTFLFAALHLCSAAVERKHLLGQEVKTHKGRGLRPTALTLAKITLQKFLQRSIAKQRLAVRKACLRGVNEEDFARASKGVRFVRHQRPGQKRVREPTVCATSHRGASRVRAYHVYYRRHFNSDAAGTDMKAARWREEQGRVRRGWRQLLPASRQYYMEEAQRQTAQAHSVGAMAYPEHRAASDAGQLPQGKKRRVELRKQAVMHTLKEMADHPSWNTTGLFSYEYGFNPKLITAEPREKVRAALDGRLAYDPLSTPKHEGPHIPFQTCSERYGGLCKQRPTAAMGLLACKNLYTLMVKHEGGKKLAEKLPRLITVSAVGDAAPTWTGLVLVVFSKGKEVVVMDMNDSQAYDGTTCHRPVVNDGAVVILSLNALVSLLVSRAHAAGGVAEAKAEKLLVTCSKFHLRPGATCFEVAASTGWSDDLPLQVPLSNPKRKKQAEPEADLPFGLKVNPEDAEPNKKKMSLHDDDEASDDSKARPEDDASTPACSDDKDEDEGDASADSDSLEVPPPAHPPPLVVVINEPGVKEYDRAASGRAVCFLCAGAIPVGMWRVRYRMRRGTALRDLRYAHGHCAPNLPMDTRDGDLRRITDWSIQPDLGPEEYDFLDNLLASMSL